MKTSSVPAIEEQEPTQTNESLEEKEAASESVESARQKLLSGPTLLDAKWLDPECWHGCKSLVFKHELRDALDELRHIVNADLAGMRKEFGSDADRQFRLWAQNRARAVIEKAEKRVLSEHATKSEAASGSPESTSLSATTQAEGGPPPCALCGKPPHPDSVGHSYRPLEEPRAV